MGDRTAVLVCAYDSQLKWASAIRVALEARGVTCQMMVPTDRRHAVSEEQQTTFAGAALTFAPWREIVRAAAVSDIAVLGVHGPLAARFSNDLYDLASAKDGQRPPVTVSGWVGVIIEKITSGYLDRFSTDVVAVNSRSDYDVFSTAAAGLGLGTDNLVLSGLPFLAGGKPAFAERPEAPKALLFADQPTVPATGEDRLYVYQRLISYAERHPERRVILKPRHRQNEDTLHRMQFHPEVVLRGKRFPENFSIDYTPIPEQLESIDLMLTLSSTAALEAIGAGIGVAFVADLGVREQLGNHIFLGSGLLRTFDQIEADDLGTPAPSWIDDYFVAEGHRAPADVIAERCLTLLARRDEGEPTPQELAWRSSFFITQHRIATNRRRAAAEGAELVPLSPRQRVAMLAEAVLPRSVHQRVRGRHGRRRRKGEVKRSAG